MAKSKDVNDTAGVSGFVGKLEPALAKIVEALRTIILSADKQIDEQIKWNSPSFFYSGTMKPFDPKEYKRDIVVMNVSKGNVVLVFPTGAKVADKTAMLEGDYKDGRRLMTFSDLNDIKAKEKALQKVLKEWITLVDK